MDSGTVVLIVFVLVVLAACYLCVYGWVVGIWRTPVKWWRLRRMRKLGRNCYNCKYMGYECECLKWTGIPKYNPVSGNYVNTDAYPKSCGEIIGTKHCDWTPQEK